jgi:hypothetical protein
MRGAHQPATGFIEKTVWLVIHFHGHMGAPVQVSMHLPLVSNGKSAARLAGINNVKWHSATAVEQIGTVAQGDHRLHENSCSSVL